MKKNLLITSMAIFALIGVANAEIHKWVDKNGTVHFSDTASTDKTVKSEVINVQDSNSISSGIEPTYSSSFDNNSNASINKPSISITQPSEAAIRDNAGNVNIQASVGDANYETETTLYVDGQAYQSIRGSGNLSANLSNADRGDHTIKVISSINGKQISSAEKTFTLLRAHK